MSKLTTITSPSGARFTVAADYAPKFQALIGDLETAGYGINPKASGGYNPRNIRGTNKPSNHAFGRAVDINWDKNALGTKGEIPSELARSLAAKHGMTWGGDWSRPDPMHFEVANAGPVPMGQRSLTAFAGVSKTQPSTTGTPQPMPNMLDVGGQAPVMDPAEVARKQQLAKMLMESGQDTSNMRHWTQALGSILQSGMGSYQAGQAARGLAQGQQSGNQALAQLLMGGDASAAMSNPYSAEQAQAYQMKQNDPMRQLQMKKLERDLAQPVTGEQPMTVKEWEYFNKLPAQDQQRYLDMKRNPAMVNAGTSFQDPTGRRAPIAIDNVGKQAQEEIGIAAGKAAASAPSDISAADTAIELVNSIRNDPARERGTGMSSMGNVIPGTKGYDFQRKVDQAASGAFLTAIQQLRGMGALSNAEGQTATKAVTRMSTAMTEEGFMEALQDYENLINKGKTAAQQKLMGVPGSATAPAQPARPDPLGLFGPGM